MNEVLMGFLVVFIFSSIISCLFFGFVFFVFVWFRINDYSTRDLIFLWLIFFPIFGLCSIYAAIGEWLSSQLKSN